MTDTTLETFENDSFIVQATREAGCQLALTIEIKPSRVKKVYKQAIKKINKDISIPGFRKGKAPEETVIKNYSNHIEKEWKENLLNDALSGAFSLTKIYPLRQESIKRPAFEKCSLEEGALVNTGYEHYPEVPPIDFSKIKLPKLEKNPVKTERIDEILQEIQRSNADFEPVTDRAAQADDYVDVSIDAIDIEPIKPIVKDRRMHVSEKGMTIWLKNLLIGMKGGETKEGTSELDPNADAKTKKQFRPTKVRIVVHSIQSILPPPLDDALAKKVGVASFDELKKIILNNLEKESEAELKERQTAALNDALVKFVSFDLPTSLVEAETKERISQRLQALQQDGGSESDLQKQSKKIEEEALKDSLQALKLYFIEHKIEAQGEIVVSSKELNEEIVKHMTQNALYYKDKLDKKTTERVVSRIKDQLLKRKIRAYALSEVLNLSA